MIGKKVSYPFFPTFYYLNERNIFVETKKEKGKKEKKKKKLEEFCSTNEKETRKKCDKVRWRMDVWWTVSPKYVHIVRACRK